MSCFPLAYSHGHPIMFYEMDNFLDPTCQFILLSDMHDMALTIAEILHKMGHLKDSIVIAAGDMAGTGKLGSDGDPIAVYSYFVEHAKAFYFVQGNHDYFSDACESLRNSDGSLCSLDQKTADVGGLRIGGVHGIIGKDKPGVHKRPANIYHCYLKNVLKRGIDVLVTHETPTTIDGKLLKGLPLHLFGHHHRNKILEIAKSGETSVCLDGRVLFLPIRSDV